MKDLHDNSFLNLENKVELPEGTKYINKSGLWVIHQDLQEISLYSSTSSSPRLFSAIELQLTPPNDEIKAIDFIEQDQIYIFAIRNKVPTGFFMKIKDDEENDVIYLQEEDDSFILPNTLSFALDSLYFHRQILASFTPINGSFCIVSKEGITLHDQNFQTYFMLNHQIRFCLCSDNFLYISDGIKYTIYQFELKIYQCNNENISSSNINLNIDNEESENKVYKSFYEATEIANGILTADGYPCSFISLTSCLLIILKNIEKQSFHVQIHDLSSDDSINRVIHDISREVKANIKSNYQGNTKSIIENYIPYFHFLKYDDCLLSVDISNAGSSNLLDFNDNLYISVGGQFMLQNDLHIIGIFNQDFALCDDHCIYKIIPNYSKIKIEKHDTDHYFEVTASIMRRKDGINNAFDRLREMLTITRDYNQLKKIVMKIGPSATDPVAQMKFSRLIQFSGLSDPHLISLGLIQFSFVLGDKIVSETWIPLLEIFAHSQIENLLDDAVKNGIIKLNSTTIKNLTLAFNKKIHIDENIYSVDNLIDYANAYIDMEMYDDAKLIINIAQLSDMYPIDQINKVKERLNQLIKNKEDNCQENYQQSTS
ncbi:hypothetical protein M9Y10_038990 [Tritrichomonas musculus]|uniref:Uncharacterized protein n=1 Tax=Tritrichomonas musculus TaxID=1915356 RepID=A0ABR2KB12_9EUKA